MPDIKYLARLDSSPERTYQALTSAEDIRRWWVRNAVLDSGIGGVSELGSVEGRVATRMKLDELTPPTRVSWRTISSGEPGWDGTTVTFDLRAEGGVTLLLLAHRGFSQADGGYEETAKGWARDLLSLHRYLETGEGRPH
jgi:uncharacterized protein YndB with AHSA1/START domain